MGIVAVCGVGKANSLWHVPKKEKNSRLGAVGQSEITVL